MTKFRIKRGKFGHPDFDSFGIYVHVEDPAGQSYWDCKVDELTASQAEALVHLIPSEISFETGHDPRVQRDIEKAVEEFRKKCNRLGIDPRNALASALPDLGG